MRDSVFRGEKPGGRDLKEGHTHRVIVVSTSSVLGEDPQEEGSNLRNGDPVGTAEMADG